MSDLSQFDGAFKAHKPKDRTSIPDGTYDMRVELAEMRLTKKPPPRHMLVLKLMVLDGEHDKTIVFRNSVLDKPRSIQQLKDDLYTMGVLDQVESLADLPNLMFLFDDMVLRIRKVTSDGYENYNIDERLDSGVSPDAPRDSAPAKHWKTGEPLNDSDIPL